ncbi:sensor histidine kinase [Actinomadura terrae]|uniref:sensor histidine kinase n=1 Tax=Actinomadura terrae TaxID=604353 RepID=UPI001FA71796|nr:histidine kinase [Actinomadura terrae]
MRDRWVAASYLFGALCTAVVTVVGAPLLAVPAQGRAWADRHRRRAGRLLGVPVPPMPPARVGPALRRGLLWPVVHVATALPFGLALVLCVGNIVTAVVAMTTWWAFPADAPPHLQWDVPVDGWTVALTAAPAQAAVLVAVAWWGGPPLARLHARICLALLAPTPAEMLSDRLSARVETLTRTRADALDAHAAELRRIERDLHDGVQARLVAVAVRLGVARESLTGAPADVATLVGDAHEGVEEAMTELRGVVRGVYPPILADRGLAGALAALAADSAVPTRLRVGRLDAVPAAVETVAYFAVTEALANIAKHARATRAEVRVERAGDRLSILVTDDGAGGAGEARGTGLAGIRRRVAALDGALHVTSPPGGPTALAVEVPCGS